MRPRLVRAATALAGAALLAGCGGGGGGGAPGATGVDTAYVSQVRSTILVTTQGTALYMFVPDRRKVVTCTGACAATWPPLYAPSSGRVRAGTGTQPGLFGSDADPAGGRRVVTYDGWPLYTYASDLQPGAAYGQGVDLDGGYWYVVRPNGVPLVPAGDPAPVAS